MKDKEIYTGVVVKFSNKKNFGFIEWFINNVKQPDMFVHYSDIDIEGYRTLSVGQTVYFKIDKNNEGRPKATNVIVI